MKKIDVISELPMCAVCGRAVERVDVDHDILRNLTIFVARCHGATEEVELTAYDIEGTIWRCRMGVAFATKELGCS